MEIGFGVSVFLQWNDPFSAAGTDYDLFVCPQGLTPTKFNIQNYLCQASTRVQDGDDRPLEVVNAGFSGDRVDIYIHQYAAGPAKRLELFTVGGRILEHGVPAGGIIGHAAVDGVVAVGAVSVSDPGHDRRELRRW